MSRVVVIGAGPAGLMAALTAARGGVEVRVIAKGWGSLYWHAGCIDVLATDPSGATGRESPGEALHALIADRPEHPYAKVGGEGVAAALSDLAEVCAAAGYPLRGSLEANVVVPTAVGGVRPTCLVPETMVAGVMQGGEQALIVGFRSYADLTPELVCDNLSTRGINARPVTLDVASLGRRKFVTAPVLAGAFESEAFRSEVIALLRPKIGRAERVGFPAVLGLQQATAVVEDLRTRLGVDVFEIPGVPPSVPGMRLHQVLTAAIRAAGGRVNEGMEALGVTWDGDRVSSVRTESAGHDHHVRGDIFILATGGILGGGIVGDESGELREVVMDLAVDGPDDRSEWLRRSFTDPQGHPVYRCGVGVDAGFRPQRTDGSRPENVFVAGNLIGGTDPIRDRAVDGIAIATGRAVGLAALEAVAGGVRS